MPLGSGSVPFGTRQPGERRNRRAASACVLVNARTRQVTTHIYLAHVARMAFREWRVIDKNWTRRSSLSPCFVNWDSLAALNPTVSREAYHRKLPIVVCVLSSVAKQLFRIYDAADYSMLNINVDFCIKNKNELSEWQSIILHKLLCCRKFKISSNVCELKIDTQNVFSYCL